MKILKTELPKALVGILASGLLSLFVYCLITMYNSYQFLQAFDVEVLKPGQIELDRLSHFEQFVQDTSLISNRSAKRTEQLEKLAKYKKGIVLDEQESNFWHQLSGLARIEASNDLGILSRYTEETFPNSSPVRDGLRNLLATEIKLWEAVDSHISSISKTTHDTEAEERNFRTFVSAGLEHLNATSSMQGLYLQTADRLLLSKKEAQLRYDRNAHTLRQTRKHFDLALIGSLGIFLIVIACIAYFVYAEMKKKRSNVKGEEKPTKTVQA